MPTIIVLANNKGGCGKTTTAINMAGALSSAGYRVLIVDTDPQASALLWSPLGELPFQVSAVPEGAVEDELVRLAQDNRFDIVLVDCPAGMKGATFTAMTSANATLVPLRVSGVDYKAVKPFLNTVRQVLGLNPGLKVGVFINARHNARLDKEARQSAVQLFGGLSNIRVLETEIPQLAMIAEVSVAGQTVFDYKAAHNSQAEQVYINFTKEVLQWLKSEQA